MPRARLPIRTKIIVYNRKKPQPEGRGFFVGGIPKYLDAIITEFNIATKAKPTKKQSETGKTGAAYLGIMSLPLPVAKLRNSPHIIARYTFMYVSEIIHQGNECKTADKLPANRKKENAYPQCCHKSN